MKSHIFGFVFGWLLITGLPLLAFSEINVAGGLAVRLPDAAGHSVPAVEYLRRLDRVFRQVAKLPANVSSITLTLELSERQTAGEWSFGKAAKDGVTLTLPAKYAQWHEYPLLGRALASALLQSRLGNRPDAPLPQNALWIADGLWAEFVQRELDGERIFRFLWLDGLRNVIEAGGRVRFSASSLTAPDVIRPGAAEWVLYQERSRLLLDIASRLGGKGNVLKDYVSILENTTLAPELAFDRTIGTAAIQRLSSVAPDYAKLLPEERHAAIVRALEILSERALFSVHVPLSANAVQARLAMLGKVPYRRDDGYAATGELSDLPLLAGKYESCKALPAGKIGEINELATLSPKEFHLAYFALAAALDRIGSVPAAEAAEGIKSAWAELLNKVRERQKIEAVLGVWEKKNAPGLHELRFPLGAPPEPNKVSPRIDGALDRAESELGN